MRRLLRPLLIAAVVATAVPRPAAADWHFTPFFGLTFGGDTTIVDLEDAAGTVHWNFGGAVTRIGRGPLGFEGLFVYTPGFFDSEDLLEVASSRSFALMGNVVLAVPQGWNEYGLRPFVSGGIGVMHAAQTDQVAAFPVSENLWAWNVGGGAVGFLTDRTGLRFDLRHFRNLRETESIGVAIGPVRLSYWTGSVGVVFRY
jgi:hypothetical protein